MLNEEIRENHLQREAGLSWLVAQTMTGNQAAPERLVTALGCMLSRNSERDQAMAFICGHCERATNSEPFRVITEEAGITLLDMVVCAPCAEQAKNLGLKATKVKLPKNIVNKVDE